jgi:hypothetical protein
MTVPWNRWYEVADGHWQCRQWDVLFDPRRTVWTIAHAVGARLGGETFATPNAAMEFCDRQG